MVTYKPSYYSHLGFACRLFIRSSPKFYIPLKKMQGKYGIIDRKTEIVIEGYPRCANSFAEAAFRIAQDREVCIAHHTHAPAQILAGVRRNIPILVLYRDPDDAVISRVLRNENMPLYNAYKEYIWFYDSIWPVIDRCVLSSFELTTNAFGKVIRTINNKYGSNFHEFDDSDSAWIDRTNELIDQLSIKRIGRQTHYAYYSDKNSQLKEKKYVDRQKKKKALKGYLKSDEVLSIRRRAKKVAEKLNNNLSPDI